jgi:hypothetical protein
VPDISPEREARLARVLGQGVTMARDGGDVTVNVTQVSAPQPTGRARASVGRGAVQARDRRRRLEYVRAAQRGEKFDPTYKRLGGNRNEMHALFTEHKAVSPH